MERSCQLCFKHSNLRRSDTETKRFSSKIGGYLFSLLARSSNILLETSTRGNLPAAFSGRTQGYRRKVRSLGGRAYPAGCQRPQGEARGSDQKVDACGDEYASTAKHSRALRVRYKLYLACLWILTALGLMPALWHRQLVSHERTKSTHKPCVGEVPSLISLLYLRKASRHRFFHP